MLPAQNQEDGLATLKFRPKHMVWLVLGGQKAVVTCTALNNYSDPGSFTKQQPFLVGIVHAGLIVWHIMKPPPREFTGTRRSVPN
jgi:hypothetical protein